MITPEEFQEQYHEQMVIIGDKAKRLREDAGLTCEDIAKEIGKSVSWIENLEAASLEHLYINELGALCEILGCTLSDIFSAEKEKGDMGK